MQGLGGVKKISSNHGLGLKSVRGSILTQHQRGEFRTARSTLRGTNSYCLSAALHSYPSWACTVVILICQRQAHNEGKAWAWILRLQVNLYQAFGKSWPFVRHLQGFCVSVRCLSSWSVRAIASATVCKLKALMLILTWSSSPSTASFETTGLGEIRRHEKAHKYHEMAL